MSKASREKTADARLAAEARSKADAWARSVPGTPYGTTEPVLTGGLTEFQRMHPDDDGK